MEQEKSKRSSETEFIVNRECRPHSFWFEYSIGTQGHALDSNIFWQAHESAERIEKGG